MIGNRTYLKAEDGNKLVNLEERIICKSVILGRNSTADSWIEMSEADAMALKAQWDAEQNEDGEDAPNLG